MRFGVGPRDDRRGIGAAALDERRRVALARIGQQAINNRQQLGHANAAARADETDRHQMAFAQALLEGVMQLLPGQRGFAVLQVVIHHRFVDLHHLIDDLLVGGGNIGAVARPVSVEKAIDHGTAIAAGQVERQALRTEAGAQLRDQRRKIAASVDAVDDQHARQTALLAVFHQSAGAVFDAGAGVDHHAQGFHRCQRR